MGKFDGVLIATDFDDTYCGPGGVVHPANIEAVKAFTAQGGVFTVATGRAHRSFVRHLDLAPVNVPVILSNGSQIYDFAKEEMVVATTLPMEASADFELLLELFPALGLEAYHQEALYLCRPNSWTDYHINKVGLSAAAVCPVAEMPAPWGKAILMAQYDDLFPAQVYIKNHWEDRYEAVFSNDHMLEITAKGSTKGGMVLELARRLGVGREHLYCVGDNQNDIPMLAVAAEGFAPANCAREVRDWGATILPPCSEGAVAALIALLEERY